MTNPQRKARGPPISFPMKLHRMLANAEQYGYQHILSWLPGGNSFRIHDPEGMVSILSVHFNQTKYKSFLRQIQNYGFYRVSRGPETGTCSHKLFVRWDRTLCLQMKRVGRADDSYFLNTSGMTQPVFEQRHDPCSFQNICYQREASKATTKYTNSTALLKKEGEGQVEDCCFPISNKNKRNLLSAESNNTSVTDESEKKQQEGKGLFLMCTPAVDGNREEDNSWITTLLENAELWLIPSKINDTIKAPSFDTTYEPNHIIPSKKHQYQESSRHGIGSIHDTIITTTNNRRVFRQTKDELPAPVLSSSYLIKENHPSGSGFDDFVVNLM